MHLRFVALWLGGLSISMFFLQNLVGTEPFLLIKGLQWEEPWRLVTALFAHSGVAHLVSNLFALSLFGLILEGRIGPQRVLMLFLVSGVLINIFTFYDRSLGASGAVYALIGALIALRPTMVIYMNWMPMPMALAGIIWLIQDSIGVFVPDNVANLAHINGLFIGLAAGIFWRGQGLGDKIGGKRRNKDPALEQALDAWEEKYMK